MQTGFSANIYEIANVDYWFIIYKFWNFFTGFRKQMESFWLLPQTEKMFLIRKSSRVL